MDFKDLMDGYESISRAFPTCALSIVHGKMKAAEKDYEMQRFKKGETEIMVATTVVIGSGSKARGIFDDVPLVGARPGHNPGNAYVTVELEPVGLFHGQRIAHLGKCVRIHEHHRVGRCVFLFLDPCLQHDTCTTDDAFERGLERFIEDVHVLQVDLLVGVDEFIEEIICFAGAQHPHVFGQKFECDVVHDNVLARRPRGRRGRRWPGPRCT